jgi:hypothetical protein
MAVWPVTTATSRDVGQSSRSVCRMSRTGTGAGMTDDVQVDELEPDEAESDTDDDFDRAPQPGNTPVPAPERPLFEPDADDSEDE